MFRLYALISENRIARIINKAVLTLLIVKNFPTAFFDYLKINRKPLITLKLYSGLKVKLRSNTVDSHEAVTVLSGQEYPYQLLKSNLLPSATVFDVGAHVGSFSLYCKNIRPDLRLYCFEPALDNFKILRENIAINNFSDIKLFQLAVAGRTGRKYLATGGLKSNAYALSQAGSPVDSIDLDTFIESENIEAINLIKMDCEGAEFEILANFKSLKKVRSIILEYHRQSNELDDKYLIDLMEGRGFKLLNRRDLSAHMRGILYFEQA